MCIFADCYIARIPHKLTVILGGDLRRSGWRCGSNGGRSRDCCQCADFCAPSQSGCWQGTRQENRMTRPTLRAHPIAELVPDMTPDQYGAAVDDIREHG